MRKTQSTNNRFYAWYKVFLFFTLAFLPFKFLQAEISNNINQNLWQTNSVVRDLDVFNGKIYIGGDFTKVGPYVGSAIPFKIETGLLRQGFPTVHGDVNAVISDGNGGWFIGGDFSRVGEVKVTSLAHILSDKSVDAKFMPSPNGPVTCLAISGKILFVGGYFNQISNVSRNYIASFDINSSSLNDWNPLVDNPIQSMVIKGSSLIIGGQFRNVENLVRNHLALFNIVGGVPTINPTWDPSPDEIVYSIVINGGSVYLGGAFTTLMSAGVAITRNKLASVSLTTGEASQWAPNVQNGEVYSLAIKGTQLFVGGSFSQINGESRNFLASVDTIGGAPTSWVPNPDGTIATLLINDSTLYVGGRFDNFGSISRGRLASFDINNGTITAWNPNIGFERSIVLSLGVDADSLFVGGYFTTIGAVGRDHIAAIDLNSGQPTDWNPGADQSVYAISVTSSIVFAAGEFNLIGGVTRGRIAGIDINSGKAIGWNPSADQLISSFKVQGSTIFVSGNFSKIGHRQRRYLAALDINSDIALPWDPSPNYIVTSFDIHNSTMYVAGQFGNIGGRDRSFLASLDLGSGLANEWNPAPDSLANTFTVHGSSLYVGGDFSTIAGERRDKIAVFNVETTKLIDWNPGSVGLVHSIEVDNNTVYIGSRSDFRAPNAQPLRAVSSEDGFPTPWVSQVVKNGVIFSLKRVDSALFVGGIFYEDDNYFEGRQGLIQFGEVFPSIVTPPTVSQSSFSSVGSLKIYPNPFIPGKGTNDVTFTNLPAGTEISIFSLTGALVTQLTSDSNGTAIWKDIKNDSGQKVSSGVYYVLAKGNGTKKTKVAIER